MEAEQSRAAIALTGAETAVRSIRGASRRRGQNGPSRRGWAVVWSLMILALGIGTAASAASNTVIKLATLVPDGSVWDKELKGMGAEWGRVTGGRVTLRIYAGGVAGDEPDIVRKMRIGQLQAATLTVSGLAELDDSFTVFNIPTFFASYDELFHVVEALAPTLERRLADKGFVLLNWGHAGWVQLFSKRAIYTPEDLKSLKLFTWAGDNRMVQWWKDNGFRPVALSATDILTGLETGMIEALPTTALAALSLQWFRRTEYMLDLGLAPLVGATVLTEKAWSRIAPADQQALKKAALGVEERLEAAIPQQDRQAIAEMEKRGLEVTRPRTEAERQSWTSAGASFAESMRQAMVPDDVFRLAVAARDAYRRRTGSGG